MPMPRKYASHAERQAAYRRRLAEGSRRPPESGTPPGPAVATMPGYPRWRGLIRQALLLLETVGKEMEEYYAQRSDKWQESERGEAFLERLQTLQEAQATLEELGS